MIAFSTVFIFALLAVFMASPLHAAGDILLQEASPSTATTGGNWQGLLSCVKDSAETSAYCGSLANYVVKLTLSPVAYAAQVSTSISPVVSVLLYESEGTSTVYYNDNAKLKYIDGSFSGTPSTADTTVYTFNYQSRMAMDASNRIIYISDYSSTVGGGKIIKVTGIDSGHPSAMDHITMSGTDDAGPSDLILADTGDLYVSMVLSSGNDRLARVTSPSSATDAAYTKTVVFTDSTAVLRAYPCLYQIGSFIYAVTSDYGMIVKLSIGSTDEDFAEVAISPSIRSEAYSSTSLITPDLSHIIVICQGGGEIHFFDVASMTYQTDHVVSLTSGFGGFVLSNKRVTIGHYSTNTLYNFNLMKVTAPPSSSSSSSLSTEQKIGLGVGIGVGVPVFIVVCVLLYFFVCLKTGDKEEKDNFNNNNKNNAPDDGNDEEDTSNNKEMDELNAV